MKRPKTAARSFAAIVAIAALLLQFWAPVINQAKADLASDSSYAEFVRVFGAYGVLCLVDRDAPSGKPSPGKNVPAHDPLQCPICQSLHTLSSVVPPASIVLILPPASDGARALASAAPFVAPHFYLSGEARAPPLTI